MTTGNGRRRPTKLSAEAKWEIFLQVASGEVTQAEAARKWTVDVSTIITIRRTVKERNWELDSARNEIGQLTEAVKAQAIELAIIRGKSGWG